MVNILKFQHTEESKIFFVSDLHYYHATPNWEIPIWKQRGFDNFTDYCNGIIKNHNNTVTNNDICFFLGDSVVGAGNKSVEIFKQLFFTLNYKIAYILPGNHWAGYRQLFNEAIQYGNKIDEYYSLPIREIVGREIYFIPNYYEVLVNNRLLVLSHYPILSWRDMSKGSVMLYGHVHNNLKKTDWIKDNYLKGKNIDLSWDCYKRPLHFNEIVDIVDKKFILKIDHH
jgi:calcineurin-like phosphoesterase family protein